MPLGDTPGALAASNVFIKANAGSVSRKDQNAQEAFAYLILLQHNQHHRKSLAIRSVIASYTKVVFIFCADNDIYLKCVPSYCKL